MGQWVPDSIGAGEVHLRIRREQIVGGAMGVECISVQRVTLKRNMPQRNLWGSLAFKVQVEETQPPEEPDTT